MATTDWSRVKEIVDAAIRRTPEERAAFLAEACDGNEEVRREVESLLSSFGRADGFMEKPAFENTGHHETEELTFLPDGQLIGHYAIVRRLGVGGMGVVYLAKDQKLDRHVAIKLLNKRYEQHEENLRRFVQEAKAASALNHPNILTIYEIAEFEGSRCIVSEYVEGRTLREILKREKLGLDEIADISAQIASALAVAHKARIIHRDVKPENIVVRDDDYVKVLDFGLAKLLPTHTSLVGHEDATIEQNQTAKGLILGTVSYMSPEQAKGEAVDVRTDIFSLGVLIYEMLTGRTPFSANSTSETLANLINQDPEPLSRHVSGIPDDLQRIVLKMLRKNPDERYQTMKGVMADLKELREQITIESKLTRISLPASEEQTDIFQKTTGRAATPTQQTLETRAAWFRSRAALAVTSVALLAMVAAAVWYWNGSTIQPQTQIKSLAVLPLKSFEPGENYLGLGIADALIRRISQTGALTVRPTSAVRRYLTQDIDALGAARELSADAVLEGSVQRAGDRLRISVNLLRTADGASLWADSFDIREADIFAIQDSVARQVADRLRLHLNPAQQASLGKHITNDPLAYEYYVKGVYNFDLRGLGAQAKPQAEATAELFRKAIQVDPNFALAHSQLAYVYAWLAVFVEPSAVVWKQRAEEEIAIATKIDPEIAETHIARGVLLSSAHYGWQTDAGIREYLEAQRLNPSAAHPNLADLYYHIGLDDLCEREFQIALEVDPTSKWTKTEIRYFYNNYRKFDEYETASRNFFPGERIWSSYYIGKRRLDEAEAVLNQEIAEEPSDPYLLSDKAKILALRGNLSEAEALIPEILKGSDRLNLTNHHRMYEVACNYALLGNSKEAVRFLREAAATGFPAYTLFERDSFLDPIRSSPEFISFMAEMKPLYERRRNEFK
jgi:eukaryotic-like serine/threonine-protein kinase